MKGNCFIDIDGIYDIFTSINNTTTILFPTQLWELLYTYHVIKQCTEKVFMICILIHSFTMDLRLLSDIVVY
jgi:hypothetical protein